MLVGGFGLCGVPPVGEGQGVDGRAPGCSPPPTGRSAAPQSGGSAACLVPTATARSSTLRRARSDAAWRSSSLARSAPNVSPSRRAMFCDSATLPFSRFDSAGLPTPSFRAASVTVIPGGMTCCRMKRLTSVERFPDPIISVLYRDTLQASRADRFRAPSTTTPSASTAACSKTSIWNKVIQMRTDYLFAAPSLSSGVARLLDLFGQFDDYNDSPSAASADARAMYSDWRVTGEDLAGAMMAIEREQAEAIRQAGPTTGPTRGAGRTGGPTSPGPLAVEHASVEYFQGPVPPPEALERYESILPGCADRIVSMAEAQATHDARLNPGLFPRRSRPNEGVRFSASS